MPQRDGFAAGLTHGSRRVAVVETSGKRHDTNTHRHPFRLAAGARVTGGW